MDNKLQSILFGGAVAASLLGMGMLYFNSKQATEQQETNQRDRPTQFDEVTVSKPYNFSRDFSITYDRETGKFIGIPEEVKTALEAAGYKTKEDVLKNPEGANQILYSLEYHKIRPKQVSLPFSFTHNVHLTVNSVSGKIDGLPPAMRDAIDRSGYTDDQVAANPQLVKDILYSLDPEKVIKKPEVSRPLSYSHDFSISVDSNGNMTGVPSEILDAIKLAGYTYENIKENPSLLKNLLYNFNYENLKPGAPKISSPQNFKHDFSITVDPKTGELQGVPSEILEAMKIAGYTKEKISKNPEIVQGLLYNFKYDHLKPDAPSISVPSKSTHDFHISVNSEGEPVGLPDEILEAIKLAGYTPKEILNHPEVLQPLLYNFDYKSLAPDAPKISAPVSISHDFQISIDPVSGTFKGIPEPVIQEITKAGFTMEQVLKDPSLILDLVYKLDYDALKPRESLPLPVEVSRPTNVTHVVSITPNPDGTLSGIPVVVRQELEAKGFKEEEVLKDPSQIKDVLYSIDYEQVVKEAK